MGTKDKLIERFRKQPKDFTWEEFIRLFGIFGFIMDNKGRTSGSRVVFRNGNVSYIMHKPHPLNVIKKSSMKQALDFFTERNLIIKNNDEQT